MIKNKCHDFSSCSIQSEENLYIDLSSSRRGLTNLEAESRLKVFGLNEATSLGNSGLKILGRQFKSPFLYLLIAAAGLSFFLGEIVDAAMIIGFVIINILIGFFQEYHSEHAIKLLKKIVSSKVLVRREGKEFLIDSKNLVPGDILIVQNGDRINADIRWLEVDNLQIDEAVLTGESALVTKICTPLKEKAKNFFAGKNIGFSGTMVASGRGVGLVFATASQAEFSKILHLTSDAETPGTFEKGITKFSAFILRVILITLVLVFAANLLVKGWGVDLPELLIFSVALAVSVIPEALPVVTTMTFSRGALRLAKKQVVVKRLSAIEDLGSIDVLCVDKTGTITENKMALASVFSQNQEQCLWFAALGAPAIDLRFSPLRANFDGAILNHLSRELEEQACLIDREHEKPFDPVRRWNSVVVKEKEEKILIVRGAPENILALCDISQEEEQKNYEFIKAEGQKGRRVLAIAFRRVRGDDFSPETGGLFFSGIISFEDPIKKTTKSAVLESERLGLKIKIFTGDASEVAAAVGLEIGLIKKTNEVMTGEEWARLSETERQEKVQEINVFSRVTPEQKYLLIQALQKKFEVGFLGEGINDAPALKIANVGLVVDGASDVAREAADLVLLDHSLEAVIAGIREGREIFANTIKYIKSTLTSNFGNFIAVACATLLVSYLPMLPIQILLLNLLSDFPMIAVAMDAVDPEELKRPRHYNIKEVAYIAMVLGLISTIFDFLFFALFSRISPEVLQTNWFIASILTELVLIFSIRTKKMFFLAKAPASILLFLILLASIITLIIPFTVWGQNIFRFVQPTVSDLTIIFSLVVLYLIITEAVKYFYYRFMENSNRV